jgi:tetratricopeptide (TPR) repeat protein
MKLTKSTLKRIIKEEIQNVLFEEEAQKDSSNPKSKRLNSLGMRYYRKKKYKAALKKFIAAHKADPKWTKPPYNAGCQYALLGNVDKALHWLTIWTHNRPDKNLDDMYNFVQKDTDLDGIRKDPKFQSWLELITP